MSGSTSERGRRWCRFPPEMVRPVLTLSLLIYAIVAVLVARWWISGVVAPLVAALLWMQHPRARFAAYIFFTVAAVRGLFRGAWPVTAFAIAAILLLQTPAAARAWPRLRGSPSRGR